MKYFLHFIFFSVCLFSSTSYAQTLESYTSFGGETNDWPHSLIKDTFGNIYVVGQFSDTVHFNSIDTIYENVVDSTNLAPGLEMETRDAFLAKYNSDMSLLWIIPLGLSGYDIASEILLDDSLNIYIMGVGEGEIDFDPSNNTQILNGGPLSIHERFIIKYDNNGNFIKGNRIHGNGINVYDNHFFKDDLGSIYAYGGDSITKLNTNLDIQWSNKIGGYPEIINQSEIQCIRSFQMSNYHLQTNKLVLERYNVLTGDLIDTTLYGHTEGMFRSGFIRKANNGDLIIYGDYWGNAQIYGGGNIVEMIYDYSEVTQNPPTMFNFVSRFSNSGELIWAKAYDNKGPNPNEIITDDSGNIYLVGYLFDYANFDPVNEIIHTTSQGASYIAKYDSDFNYLAMSQFLGTVSGVHDIKIYEDTLLMCGWFNNPADLDIDLGTTTVTSNGLTDGFVAKYSNFDVTGDPVSVGEHDVDNVYFTTYVNASKKTIEINVNEAFSLEGIKTVEIYSLKGQLLYSEQTHLNVLELNTSRFQNTAYVIRVSCKDWSATEKIITIN